MVSEKAQKLQEQLRNPFSKAVKTLWNHKKKTAVGLVASFFFARYLLRLKRDADIRSLYAKEALKFGRATIGADDRPRRVTVLANIFANERGSFDNFSKNALPLLNLAGIEVNVIRAEDEDKLEAIAAAIDKDEADALFVVGGDGTVSRVLTGIFRNRDRPAVPIGVFPAGAENRGLLTLVPHVFGTETDVRRFCESAMALIEETKKECRVVKCQVEGEEDPRPVFGLSDVTAGWFLHAELKKKKLWYWAGLKRRFAYFWEMLKRYPEKMVLSVEYEEFCEGCQKCRPAMPVEVPQWRWWHALIGSPRPKSSDPQKKDYSQVTNEKCGQKYEVMLNASDLLLDSVQYEDVMAVRLRSGGSNAGRWAVMREGWRRCKAGSKGVSPTPADFYETDILARSLQLTFQTLPDFIRRITVFGEVLSLPAAQSPAVATPEVVKDEEMKKDKVNEETAKTEGYPSALRIVPKVQEDVERAEKEGHPELKPTAAGNTSEDVMKAEPQPDIQGVAGPVANIAESGRSEVEKLEVPPRRLRFEATDSVVELYLPTRLRVSLDQV